MLEGGRFRADLLARLSGFVHGTTPLHHRREDIGQLVAALLGKLGIGPADHPTIAADAGLRLLRHPWPLNVRQLEQALLRSWTLAVGGVIVLGVSHLGGAGDPPEEDAAASPGSPPDGLWLSPRDEELRRQLLEALARTRGNVAQVARDLGKARMQLHRWMKRLRIDPDAFRP